MSFFHPRGPTINLIGKTLVIPIVSTANVAQLAVDLIITNASLTLIGAFDSGDLVPVVGGRDDGLTGVTTPLELFGNENANLICIQQRSPALKSRKQEFIDTLLKFIHESNFAAVIFLSGVDLSNRTDSQMWTPTFHIRPPNTPSWDNTPLSKLATLPIPVYSSSISQHPNPFPNEPIIPFIPGGGLTRRILSTLSSSTSQFSLPTVSLLNFVLEGDNTADARWLASLVLSALGLSVQVTVDEEGVERPVWQEPTSWKGGLSLFGTPGDGALYG